MIITVLMVCFSASLIGLEINNTRRAVHDEVLGANLVAVQLLLLSRMNWG